jgi:SAM-dependent methyltransferase
MRKRRKKPDGFQVIAHEKTFFKILDLFDELPRGKILDIPSGEGGLSHCLREMGFEVVGADIDPRFFKASGIQCLNIDMNRPFPLEDESFDYIACLEGIEHLENPLQFSRECHRILKWNGRIILSTPNILNSASRLKYFFSGFYSLCPRPLNEFAHTPVFDHINPMTYYQVRYALHSNGFQILRITTDLWRRSCFPLMFFYPLQRAYAIRSMRKEPDPRQREANKEIRKVLHSPDMLLGRTLIVEATKQEAAGIERIDASDV